VAGSDPLDDEPLDDETLDLIDQQIERRSSDVARAETW